MDAFWADQKREAQETSAALARLALNPAVKMPDFGRDLTLTFPKEGRQASKAVAEFGSFGDWVRDNRGMYTMGNKTYSGVQMQQSYEARLRELGIIRDARPEDEVEDAVLYPPSGFIQSIVPQPAIPAPSAPARPALPARSAGSVTREQPWVPIEVRFRPQAAPPRGGVFHPSIPPPPAPAYTAGHGAVSKRMETNQDGYGQQVLGRPPVNVQPPPNIEISMWEIMTFFPNWLQIPDVVLRAVRNGFNRDDLAKMQLIVMGTLTKDDFKKASSRIQKQLSHGGKIYLGFDKEDGSITWSGTAIQASRGPQDDMTANLWELRHHHRPSMRNDGEFSHYPLKLIYDSKPNAVPNAGWPTGYHRMLLTQCLDFARQNPHLDLDTSHFDWIIKTQGFQAPARRPGNLDVLTKQALQLPDPQR